MEENLEIHLPASTLATRADMGKTRMPFHTVGDNDGVFKCVINDNPNMNTEPTLTLHVCALRELLDRGS
eukprot:6394692-Prorocentrum_lima.AAC.1